MNLSLEPLLAAGLKLLPTAITLAVVIATLSLGKFLLVSGRNSSPKHGSLTQQVIMLSLTLMGVIAFVLSLPIDPEDRRQLLSLLGLILSGAVALASSSFLGNIIAGLMIRGVRTIRTGDLVAIGTDIGRITERGLFHVEIQTEDRELTTFPNIYFVTHPVRVVRQSGTIVSSKLSIGYDVPHTTLSPLLCHAAEESGLEDPFVRILEMGDFSVRYKVSGLLKDVSTLLTAQSRLNARVLDTLHDADIEIASPTLMNQRPVDSTQLFAPTRSTRLARPPSQVGAQEPKADRLAFEKADAASMHENLELLENRLKQRLKELEAGSSDTDDENHPHELRRTKRLLKRVSTALEETEDESEEGS
jgi:small conductance mechanosensitive channel